MVGLSGLEPPTSRLSGVRSNRLSYKPMLLLTLERIDLSKINSIMRTISLFRFSLTESVCFGTFVPQPTLGSTHLT